MRQGYYKPPKVKIFLNSFYFLRKSNLSSFIRKELLDLPFLKLLTSNFFAIPYYFWLSVKGGIGNQGRNKVLNGGGNAGNLGKNEENTRNGTENVVGIMVGMRRMKVILVNDSSDFIDLFQDDVLFLFPLKISEYWRLKREYSTEMD